MKVWVTRDELEGGPLCTALEQEGLTPVWEPVLTRRVVHDAADEILQLAFDDWLVLTSVYAVESVALDAARVPRVAVVGDASARTARDRGLRVEYVGNSGARSLFRELGEMVQSGTVCYPRSSLARPPDPWPGVELLSPVLYETVPKEFDPTVVERVDVATVASPSAAHSVFGIDFENQEGLDQEATGPAADLRFASIGFTTSSVLKRLGIEPWLESPDRTFESLAQAIADNDS